MVPVNGGSARVTLPDERDLQTLLSDACRRHRVPGAVFGLHAGSERVVVAHGVRNVRTGDPMTVDTVANIASVTKVFTATTLHGLLDEQGIELDTPVGALLPELAALHPGVTLRRLLDHTSGLESDLWDDFGADAGAIARYVATIPSLGSVTEPGELLSYCNSGYVALGRLVEVLGGSSFDRVVDRRLVRPLGLERTTTRLADAVQHRLALGHDLLADGTVGTRPWIDVRALMPTGGVLSTVPDLLVLARAHLVGHEAVPAHVAATMATPSSVNPEPWISGPGWGLGLTICTGPDGEPVVGHDGLWIGNGAYVRMVPGRDLAVAMIGAAGHARTVWQDVSSEVFAALGMAVPRPPAADPSLTFDAERYVGTYRRLSQDVEVTLGPDATLQMSSVPTGVLATVSAPSAVTLRPALPDVFLAAATTGVDVPVVFLGDRTRATYLHTGTRAARRVE
jgi:CubicO group peptidase (beta-lactamase class C family)